VTNTFDNCLNELKNEIQATMKAHNIQENDFKYIYFNVGYSEIVNGKFYPPGVTSCKNYRLTDLEIV